MLFRKKIAKSCAYCVHGTQLDNDQVLCIKKGVTAPSNKCSKFKYDPCKRVPAKSRALDFERYDDIDYSL